MVLRLKEKKNSLNAKKNAMTMKNTCILVTKYPNHLIN